MCSYAAAGLAIAVIGLAATGYQMNEQSQNVRASNRAGAQMAAAQTESANQSARDAYSATGIRMQQEAAAAEATKFESNKRGAQARATAKVASGEAGVAGLSVDALMADFNRQEATYRFTTDTNLAFSEEQSRRDMEGIRSGAANRGTTFRPEPVPSYLADGIRLSGQGFAAVDQYRKASNTTSTGEKKS